MKVPRGRTYHSPGFDLASLARVLVRDPDPATTVRRFETAFAAQVGRAHCVALPKARTAVYYALADRALPEGSRIVMPPMTIVQMMDVVLRNGLRPDFVDIELDTFGFDIDELEARHTADTRAMLLTHLYGMVPDMERLMAYARRHDIFVIEDFSQNLNAAFRGQQLGSFGDVGIYSASTTKSLDTYNGGLVVTDDPDLATRLRKVQSELPSRPKRDLWLTIAMSLARGVATEDPLFSWATFPMLQWLRRTRPDLYRLLIGAEERHESVDGSLPRKWSYAFSPMQAAVGSRELPLTTARDRARRKRAQRIREALRRTELHFPVERADAHCVYWQLIALSDRGTALQDELLRRGVDAATSNLDLVSSFTAYPDCARPCPNAERLKHGGLFVPIHPWLSERQIDRVAAAFVEACAVVGLGPAA